MTKLHNGRCERLKDRMFIQMKYLPSRFTGWLAIYKLVGLGVKQALLEIVLMDTDKPVINLRG